ncbi:MAG TPA: tetratricopeptide repeat protein [Candidatus Acidoferrum sp.]|nr:tetratricopeptide repeat protein [Candidatus Acidoferrum sp.]
MSDTSNTPPLAPPDTQGEVRFDSWKEIAAYLKREVRTVQRWEKSEGLPIRRHQHQKQGSVFAYKTELDAWRAERQSVLDAPEPPEPVPAQGDSPSSSERGLPEAPSSTIATERPWALRGRIVAVGLGIVLLGAAVYVFGGSVYRWLKPNSKFTGKARLVVLPFRNLGNDPSDEVFCRGLTEAMTTQLGRLDPEHLGVMASATASMVKDQSIDDIRRKLNVDYVLEGSVVRSGSQMRIDAQLIRASDQTHRWADTYTRDAGDVLTLQNEVAHDVAAEIRLTLSPSEAARLNGTPTVDPEAYDAYLRGLVYWSKRTPDGVAKSIDYFQQAIQKSPDFALAYAGLANAYSVLSAVPMAAISPLEAMPKAKVAAETAVRLDPESAEAHAALGLVRQSYDYDLGAAEREYERALEINPSDGNARHWRSLLLMARGRNDSALEEIERARSVDPLSLVIPASRIQAFYFNREFDRAIEESRRTLEVEPDFLLVHYNLGQSLLQKGRTNDAIAELQKIQKISGDLPFCVMAVGHAYAVAGQRGNAMKALASLHAAASNGHYVPAIYFTAIYAGLGDRDQAMKWLDEAYQERTEYLIYLKVEPMADPLRSDPRFKDLVHRMGLD